MNYLTLQLYHLLSFILSSRYWTRYFSNIIYTVEKFTLQSILAYNEQTLADNYAQCSICRAILLIMSNLWLIIQHLWDVHPNKLNLTRMKKCHLSLYETQYLLYVHRKLSQNRYLQLYTCTSETVQYYTDLCKSQNMYPISPNNAWNKSVLLH